MGIGCRSPSEPDDMALGRRLKQLKVPATHHSGFHQRRPWDYPKAARLLGPQEDGPVVPVPAPPFIYHNIFSQTKNPIDSILRRTLLSDSTPIPAQPSRVFSEL